jgi:hypothetical protein
VSELYRPNDRRLSAELVPTLANRGCCVDLHNGSLWPDSRISRPKPLHFFSKQLHSCTHEAEWTPFQTHCFSENLVALEIEPGPLDL